MTKAVKCAQAACACSNLRGPNLFASAYLMVRLNKNPAELVRNLGTPRGRRSLYDFAVVSLAVWLLGGLAVLVLWVPSAENQSGGRLSAGNRGTPAQQLPVLRRELHGAEADYQRATVDLSNVAIEHALHRQAVSTFLARHFRDLSAESVPDQQSRSSLTKIPYDESLAREAGEAVTVPINSAGAGWGPKRQVSYVVTTEGPSATYELPRSPQKSNSQNSAIEERKRFQGLEAAAQDSARLLESAVLRERIAWDRMQEAISVYHAAKDFSTIGERTPNAAAATASSDSDSTVALGLGIVTALSVGAGYVFVRKTQGLPATEPRVISNHTELATQLGLPVLGSVPAPAGLIAESQRRVAARVRRRTHFDTLRFAAESVVSGVLLMWAMLALLQPGFADRFFEQPARAVSEVASRL